MWYHLTKCDEEDSSAKCRVSDTGVCSNGVPSTGGKLEAFFLHGCPILP